ncbi:MAG: potassium-transporting ATPase subunit KdpC [Candidatus Eremiobacteraeota bacterium]|nr:potassium-transporting ATPase subunit KdpC [Candidatus Eremiobacteraeota bacterium]MBV9647976.1 potassium-transporting ATPase subunit KdpC [Candidatus Eremiobacteraeota bacterium]
MLETVQRPLSAGTERPGQTPARPDSTLHHVRTAVLFTIISLVVLGLVYPLVIAGLAQALFPSQANGSFVSTNGKVVGSDIIGQLFTKPRYFHGRPSAAGKNGYDPTSTSATNLGPTSKKLIDATKATITALKKENPDATAPIPMDLVTSSASGIDPDISPEGAYYQAARVAKVRGLDVRRVQALIAAHIHPRELGFLGEPHVNVLELNIALDGLR